MASFSLGWAQQSVSKIHILVQKFTSFLNFTDSFMRNRYAIHKIEGDPYQFFQTRQKGGTTSVKFSPPALIIRSQDFYGGYDQGLGAEGGAKRRQRGGIGLHGGLGVLPKKI